MMIYTRDTLSRRSVRTHAAEIAGGAELKRDALAAFAGTERLASVELAAAMGTEPYGLARALRSLGIRPKAMKFGHSTLRGYSISQFS